MTAVDHGLSYLLTRLVAVEQRIRRAVADKRAVDPNPDDSFRGLYLSEEAVRSLLAARRPPYPAPQPVRPEPDTRLHELSAAAGLTELDEELLLVAFAPDVDSRFEQFYGYLNDDVTRRRATVGLALRLCGLSEADATGRLRVDATAPLRHGGLLELVDQDRPLLSRALRVPDRVTDHLLGVDRTDATVVGVLSGDDHDAGIDVVAAGPAHRAIADGARLVYLREQPGGSGAATGVTALRAAGYAALDVAYHRMDAADPADLVPAVVREALLRGGGIVLGPLDGADPVAVLDSLATAPVPVIAYGTGNWNPQWCIEQPLLLTAESSTVQQRSAAWRSALDGRLAPGVDAAAATRHFVLSVGQIRRAATAAALAARADGGPITERHLRHGARSQNSAGLERLARRIEPAVGYADLVLPDAVLSGVRELAGRARYRDRVLREWRMRPGGGRGNGVTALFAGDSGTGKTMSAEAIAAGLGVDLYTVNLATVVDKYVGETEKNLERIFTEAAGINGVLLFDEADAIFGKRSEVRDAHDRYANIESAYLLQRMETFDGLAVLATNLRANLDDAFTRRLDVVVDFPMPDEAHRRTLWDRCLAAAVPRAANLDLDFLAGSFELAGGHIRSAAITAAYLAAEGDCPVGMREVIGAVAREYRKLGRLCLEREFGRYLDLVS